MRDTMWRHERRLNRVRFAMSLRTGEDLCLALIDMKRTYDENWLIGRHGHRSPAQFRRDQSDKHPLAA